MDLCSHPMPTNPIPSMTINTTLSDGPDEFLTLPIASTNVSPELPEVPLPPLPPMTTIPTHALLSRKRSLNDGPFSNSSDVPLFSSDDAYPSLENYDSHRSKRQYRGTWWGENRGADQKSGSSAGGPLTASRVQRKREFKRAVDSGVWMNSDDMSTDSEPEGLESWGRGERRLDEMAELSEAQLVAYKHVQKCVEDGIEVVDLR